MAELIKATLRGTPIYLYIVMAFGMGMFIGGFFAPPMGIIDGSVLKAVGIMIGGCALLQFIYDIPAYLDKGAHTKFSLKEGSLEVDSHHHHTEQ